MVWASRSERPSAEPRPAALASTPGMERDPSEALRLHLSGGSNRRPLTRSAIGMALTLTTHSLPATQLAIHRSSEGSRLVSNT